MPSKGQFGDAFRVCNRSTPGACCEQGLYHGHGGSTIHSVVEGGQTSRGTRPPLWVSAPHLERCSPFTPQRPPAGSPWSGDPRQNERGTERWATHDLLLHVATWATGLPDLDFKGLVSKVQLRFFWGMAQLPRSLKKFEAREVARSLKGSFATVHKKSVDPPNHGLCLQALWLGSPVEAGLRWVEAGPAAVSRVTPAQFMFFAASTMDIACPYKGEVSSQALIGCSCCSGCNPPSHRPASGTCPRTALNFLLPP